MYFEQTTHSFLSGDQWRKRKQTGYISTIINNVNGLNVGYLMIRIPVWKTADLYTNTQIVV